MSHSKSIILTAIFCMSIFTPNIYAKGTNEDLISRFSAAVKEMAIELGTEKHSKNEDTLYRRRENTNSSL